MRPFKTILFGIFISSFGVSQTLVTRDAAQKPDYLVRMFHISSHLAAGVTGEKYCVLVLPDGRLRLEKSDPLYGSTAKPKVYLSSLRPDQFQTLRALLDNDQLKDLRTPELRQAGVVRDLDLFVAEIVRGDHVQSVNALKDDSHSEINPALQNLENWMISIGRQKLPQDKTAPANTCKAP